MGGCPDWGGPGAQSLNSVRRAQSCGLVALGLWTSTLPSLLTTSLLQDPGPPAPQQLLEAQRQAVSSG